MTNVGTIGSNGAMAGPRPVPEARPADDVAPFDPTPSTGSLIFHMSLGAVSGSTVGALTGALGGALLMKHYSAPRGLKVATMLGGAVIGAVAGTLLGRALAVQSARTEHDRTVESVRGPSLKVAAARILKAHGESAGGSISLGRREGGLDVGVQQMVDTIAFERVDGTNTTKAFDRYDLLAAANADGDGRVNARELKDFLATFDADHSGSLSPAEGRAVLDKHPTEGVLVESRGLAPIASLDADDDDLAGLAD